MQFLRTMTCVALVGVAAPAGAQTIDWSGFYAGAQIDFANVEIDTSGGTTVNDGNGLMFGIAGGYRFDMGNVVFGATGSASFGSVAAEPSTAVATPDPTLDTLLRAGIEIGYDLGPLLVTGGVGQAFAIMTDASNRRGSEFGSYYGLGADYMLNDQVMIGADITRTNLDNFSGQDVSVTSFGIGAAYRF